MQLLSPTCCSAFKRPFEFLLSDMPDYEYPQPAKRRKVYDHDYPSTQCCDQAPPYQNTPHTHYDQTDITFSEFNSSDCVSLVPYKLMDLKLYRRHLQNILVANDNVMREFIRSHLIVNGLNIKQLMDSTPCAMLD